MIIHVVQEGETAAVIAESYGISVERFILENEIKSPNKLVVGEALVILYPQQTYTIQEGDTLGSIAEAHNVSVMQLLRNNPYLSGREYIYPGETIVISYEENNMGRLSTYGYAYPFINKDTLRRTLPYLTYLTIYTYQVTEEGKIVNIKDEELIQLAKDYGVAPIMMLTGAGSNQEEQVNVTHQVLLNEESQYRFMEELLAIMRTKGYYGVNITIPYILPQDRKLFVEFIENFSERMKKAGYLVFTTLSLSIFEIISGIVYKGLEYAKLGQEVDGVIIITYSWGSTVGIPPGSIAYDSIKKYLSNLEELIPGEKLFFGIPSIGYMWKLPYEAGVSVGQSISYNAVLEIAGEAGAEIQYDETTKISYFQYILVDEYIVRFRDARGIDELVKLVPEFGLNGIGIWNIMGYFPQMWLVINSQYEINKII